MSASLVIVTAPSAELARALGRGLVEARLAAAVNISAGITSFYWWDDGVQEGEEALLLVKTRAGLVDPVVEFVKARHPYVCPCVIATAITAGNPDYLQWIETQTGEG